MDGVARPCVGEQFAELRPLEGGRRRLEVPGSSLETTGSSIPDSSRTRFCRAVGCWSVETRS
ncbi:hypothetical protein DMH18_11485 [Streptomyces sp. WAC 06783]|nr:hypothetical protein DMH18_11485 [Streptomyces sp. WAC 06783]